MQRLAITISIRCLDCPMMHFFFYITARLDQWFPLACRLSSISLFLPLLIRFLFYPLFFKKKLSFIIQLNSDMLIFMGQKYISVVEGIHVEVNKFMHASLSLSHITIGILLLILAPDPIYIGFNFESSNFC